MKPGLSSSPDETKGSAHDVAVYTDDVSRIRTDNDVSDVVFSDSSGACRSITGYRRPSWQRYEKRARSLCARHRETLQTRVRCQRRGYGRDFEMPAKKRENQHAMSGCTPGPWAIAGANRAVKHVASVTLRRA